MSQNNIPEKWHKLIFDSLASDSIEDRIFALDFLSQQTSLTLELCTEVMPQVIQSVVHPDTKVRYFARRARNHILDCFPKIEITTDAPKNYVLKFKEGEKLTAQQILLHKLRLGSRFVVFEAMDRLAESGDVTLVEPLLDYLKEEKDEYKVSYLLRLLGNFDDKRIPEVLQTYLNHEDTRIVANAIEALCEFDVPELSSLFADFAVSSDNRIRCNAVRALHRYSPAVAEKHIAEMVRSNNIAMQDSGVFLLRMVRPANLGELLNVANNSRYATIRLKALDIQPPSKEETANAEMLLKEDIEQPDEKRDMSFFIGFVILSAALLVIVGPNNRLLLSLLFVGIAILTSIRPDKTRTSIQKTAISMGIVSSVIWGNTNLMLLPSLMGLWLTWNGSHFNRRGKLEKAKPASVFGWFFALIAILMTQFIQGNYPNILKLAGNIIASSETLEARTDLQQVMAIISKQENFEITIYIAVAVMTIGIMTLDSWYPKKSDADPVRSSKRRLAVASIVGIFLVALLNVFHIFGLKLMLQTNGFKEVIDVLKGLLP